VTTISLWEARDIAIEDPMVARVERRDLLDTILRLGRLAPREKRVMYMRMEGLTIREIAGELGRSPHYIAFVSDNAIKKLRLCKALTNA
jgi:DNA-binding NarL/FixJ family response regulator